MFLWKGDPQPGRMWKVESTDAERHEVELVPGSFEGNDRMKVPFVDIYKIEDEQWKYNSSDKIQDDNSPEINYEREPEEPEEPVGSGSTEESWEPSEQMKEKIKEKGLDERFKKQQEENKGKDMENKKPTDPIIIRTPVLEVDASKALPILSTIEDNDENKDDVKDKNIKIDYNLKMLF